jgi:hypothetical protein
MSNVTVTEYGATGALKEYTPTDLGLSTSTIDMTAGTTTTTGNVVSVAGYSEFQIHVVIDVESSPDAGTFDLDLAIIDSTGTEVTKVDVFDADINTYPTDRVISVHFGAVRAAAASGGAVSNLEDIFRAVSHLRIDYRQETALANGTGTANVYLFARA